MKSRIVRLADSRTVRLTKGEIAAIRSMVKMNGRTGPQYDPGNVQYRTVENLITKGIIVQTPGGVPEFAEGVF